MGSFIAIQTFHISPKIYGLSSLIYIQQYFMTFFYFEFFEKEVLRILLFFYSFFHFDFKFTVNVYCILFSIIRVSVIKYYYLCIWFWMRSVYGARWGSLCFSKLKRTGSCNVWKSSNAWVFCYAFIATHLTNSIEMMATLLSCISILGLIVLTMHKLPKKIRH